MTNRWLAALFTGSVLLSYSFDSLGEVNSSFAPIPTEYEACGGFSLGGGCTGVAMPSGVASIRINPALIALRKEYAINASWHDPVDGRDFYQTGVVDSVTGSLAAGFHTTQFFSAPKPYVTEDSHAEKRLNAAVAGVMSRLAIGIGVQHVDGALEPGIQPRRKGYSWSGGLAGLLMPNLTFGISGENIANDKVRELAPTTVRAGLGLQINNNKLLFALDYKRRDRVPQEVLTLGRPSLSLSSETMDELSPEEMVTFAFQAKVYDLLFVTSQLGQSLSDDKRQQVSAALGVVNDSMALSWAWEKPYLAYNKYHQSVSIHLIMKM